MADDFDDDDVFDDVDIDEVLQRSQTQPSTRHNSQGNHLKRASRAFSDSLDAPASNKRARAQGSPSLQEDVDDDYNVDLARRILSEKFGYAAFRHEQEGAIRRILAGKNTLVVFPTGAGKSLCYQIPAMAFGELDKVQGLRSAGQPGITIVISPLIALMKDQVDVLKRRGIPAETIDSTKSWEELQAINQKLSRGELQIVYCAPERLNNERFVESMKFVAGGVRLVAVDEAHCISEWGHSFRPEYLKVARFVEEIQAERVICLTATATAKVAEDICRAFAIDDNGVFRTSPYRPNLHLDAQPVDQPSQKFSKLCSFLRKNPGPSLVYVTTQKESEDLANTLKMEGFKATAFHAGMKTEAKSRVQDDFMANQVEVVVATIAFGMGVDKPDIRSVVHYTLASTVEEYSQQVGRAGRDGKPSRCMFYICNADTYIRENFARGDLPSFGQFQKLIKDIFNSEVTSLKVGDVFKKNTNEQGRQFDIRPNPLSVIYATLELRFGLIRAITPEYSLYHFETLLPGLYSDAMANMANSDRPEARAILEHSDKKVKHTYVDVNAIVQKTGHLRANIIQILDHLDRDGIIQLTAKGVIPKFRVLKRLPTSARELDKLTKEMYVDLEQREQDALQRSREVVDLITDDKCFSLALAQHFNMGLPDGKEKCGHCRFCETGEAIDLPPKVKPDLDRERVRQVLDDCHVRDDPRFLARVAFGISSPRVRELKMQYTTAWESMIDQDFDDLLREFTAACRTASIEPNSQYLQTRPSLASSSSGQMFGARSTSRGGSGTQSSRGGRGRNVRGVHGGLSSSGGGSYSRGRGRGGNAR